MTTRNEKGQHHLGAGPLESSEADRRKAVGRDDIVAHQPCVWKLVPEQITEDMHASAVRTIVRCTGNADWPPRVWRAMLAASPTQPVTAPAAPEASGCACRWDADDKRVATCERHQGWLDVIAEWADRARTAEAALAQAIESATPLKQEGAEPVAWGQLGMLNGRTYLRLNYNRTPYPPPADVVRNLNLVPLYTQEPAPQGDKRDAERTPRPETEWGFTAADLNFFVRNLPLFLKDHAGEYVIVRNAGVHGFYPDYEAAITAGYRDFPLDSPWLLQKIDAARSGAKP